MSIQDEARERQRLAALQAYGVMDSRPDAALDRITALAADLFGAPIALVSLVDDERQWFMSRCGLDAASTPRDQAFCAHALGLAAHEVLVVEDAHEDPRFRDNPLVTGPPHIRFYAGALLSDPRGRNLGTLCIIDTAPRAGFAAKEAARLQRLAAMVMDQLEGFRSQRQLAHEELFENAFNHAPIGIALVSPEGGFLRVNDAFGALVGYSARELAALDFQTITHPDDLDRDLGCLERLSRREIESYQIDKRYLRRDGGAVWVNLSVSAIRDQTGRPRQYVAQVQDLTERMEVEARYQLMAENTNDMIVVSDLRGRALFVSAASRALTGWRPQEAEGKTPADYVHPDDLAGLVAVFQRTAAGEPGLKVRWRGWHAVRQDWVWLESSPSLLPQTEREEPRFLDVVRDVSIQVAQEAALAEATARANAATHAKSEFLANMSHELRTPLNAVVGYSRLLLESGDLTPEDRRRAGIVQGAGEALNALINDVLDFSKLEARAVELDPRPFQVADLVSEAISLVEPKARENGVRLAVEGASGGVLTGDRHRLRQVLLNFLSNAVKFTRDGTVTVRVDTAETDTGVRLKVSVADEGVGISADRLPTLFRRFAQADESVTRTFGGTGLGLAISRELIELMGGRVGAESREHEGSTFWFEVVLPPGELEAPPPRATRGRALFPGRRVLVVDDVPLNRELVQEMLRRHGCEADLAADGREAVEAVGRRTYDLVLMDVHMPVMDGLEATRAIRAAGHTALPVVALTASGTPERVQSCLDAGADGHLLKPLAPDLFERALRQALEPVAAAVFAESVAGDGAAARQAFAASMGAKTALKFGASFRRQLDERFASAERGAVRDDAHKVAGAAGMFGLSALGEAARALEEACEVGGPYEAERAAVLTRITEARIALDLWIASLESASAA